MSNGLEKIFTQDSSSDLDTSETDPFNRLAVVKDNARREPVIIELTYPLGVASNTGNSMSSSYVISLESDNEYLLVSVRLWTDPSPGCGGIAWHAGEVQALLCPC